MVTFFGLNSKFFSIPQAGVTLYLLAFSYLLYYSPVNQLNWLNTLNPIEGKQSFVQSKIFIEKSVKNIIRFSLLLIISGTWINYPNLFFAVFCFVFFPFKSLSLKHFVLLAVPWACVVLIWLYYVLLWFWKFNY